MRTSGVRGRPDAVRRMLTQSCRGARAPPGSRQTEKVKLLDINSSSGRHADESYNNRFYPLHPPSTYVHTHNHMPFSECSHVHKEPESAPPPAVPSAPSTQTYINTFSHNRLKSRSFRTARGTIPSAPPPCQPDTSPPGPPGNTS